MVKKIILSGLVLVLLFSVFLVPRLIGIKEFVTGDEPAWLIFSSNFLHALDKGQWARTVYEYHPAVTTMWVISAGIKSYFPQYTQIRHGYIDKFWELDEIYQQHGKLLSTVLFRSRMLNGLIICLLLLIAFVLLGKLIDWKTALTIILLVAFDPFYLGQSRLLNHEGMATAFIFVSILSLMVYLNQGRKLFFLFLSAISAGLGLLTKSPMILVIPLSGLMFLVAAIERKNQDNNLWSSFRNTVGAIGLWLLILAGTYFILWPGMWTDPGKMLYEIYGNAFSYAFQGKRLLVTQELNPTQFGLEASGISTYISAILYKTTPVIWLGTILAIPALFDRKTAPLTKNTRQMIIYFGLLVVMFILMFGIARGRNSIHYILSCFLALDIIAGIGLVWLIAWLGKRFPSLQNKAYPALFLGILILFHGYSGLPQYPYYYTYTNPIMQALEPGGQDPAAGYGEVLNLAGEYLSQKPGAENMLAVSELGIGSFSYYFTGQAYPLMYSGLNYLNDRAAQWVRDSDYLVIYNITQDVSNLPANLLAALDDVEPEHSISLNELYYLSIYRTQDLPQRVFDSLEPPD